MFVRFVGEVEPRLRRALTAAYGSDRGREATAEALAWAWEHRDRLTTMGNPVGYLYRVGQSRSRGRRSRFVIDRPTAEDPWVEPKLEAAVASLPEKQRVTVLLVLGAGWTQTEVADLLGVRHSTVQQHLGRGLAKLRRDLGGSEP